MAKPGQKSREEWSLHPENFGGLPSPDDAAKVVILPLPYETSTTYQPGCRRGPAAIIDASVNMELYDEELLFDPSSVGIFTARPIEPADDPKTMVARIQAVTRELVKSGKFVLALGGEHTVSVGTVRAMREAHGDLSVLFLDAHADFRESYHGNPLNHGCVARRISEMCSVRQIGIRSLSKEEAVSLQEQELEPLWAHVVRSTRGQGDYRRLIERLVDELTAHVYVSIDADALDPSIMPAVGTPEPGGLLWDEMLDVLRCVCEKRKVVGADFVELAPIPGLVHPEFLAAKLIYKLLGYIFRSA